MGSHHREEAPPCYAELLSDIVTCHTIKILSLVKETLE